MLSKALYFLFVLTSLLNCALAQTTGVLVDSRDGKKYKTIRVDKFEIMAENLNYEGAGLCYDLEKLFCSDYGRLYNYNEIYRGEEICPKGWHVPTEGEWKFILTKLEGKVETTQLNFLLHQNSNALMFQAGGYGNTDGVPDGRVSFLNLTKSGFYATSSLRNIVVFGKELTEWSFISFWDNSSADRPKSKDYRYIYNLGSTSPRYYLSCRCMKDY